MNLLTEPQIILAGSAPLAVQVSAQLRACIENGTLWPGEHLPSVRALAVALAVNPQVIERAYALLEAEGLLNRRDGSGVIVRNLRRRRGALTRLCADFLERTNEAGHAPATVLKTLRSLIERRSSS